MAKKNKNKKTGKKSGVSFSSQIIQKSLSRTRQDVAKWKSAETMAFNVDTPKMYPLYNLYRDILLDTLLSSQINNRKGKSLSSDFSIKKENGEIDQELTDLLKNATWFNQIIGYILDSVYFGYTLIELGIDENEKVTTELLPRQNVIPQQGIIVKEYTDDDGIDYINSLEYGTWLLDFGKPGDIGLLNKLVPHVLFKRFAQSCWSELCEIYGIPPRVMKTNTADPGSLRRAKKMMTDMGAAAWFIIDDTEKIEWADAVNTNGDVFKNFTQFCNNEISMALSGAIVGQDTKNGSNAKEQASQEILQDLVNADKNLVESYMNDKVMQALYLIGLIPSEGLRFEFDSVEDIGELWNRTKEVLPYKNVDDEWLIDKFGIQVTGDRSSSNSTEQNNQNLSFFD